MTHTPAIFGVPFFARALEKVMKRYGIKTHYQMNLVSIEGEAGIARFEDENGKLHEYEFDMIYDGVERNRGTCKTYE